jgi:hypothetical protein
MRWAKWRIRRSRVCEERKVLGSVPGRCLPFSPTPCPTADDLVCREVENARISTSAVSVRALELNISIGLHEFTRSEAPVSRGLCVL